MARILVIDDDLQILRMVQRTLEHAGHAVAVVSTPFGATHQAMAWKPDLIILDVSMPGLRGDTLARLLKQELPGTHILFYSALDDDELRRLSSELRIEVLPKTTRPSALAQRVAAIIADLG